MDSELTWEQEQDIAEYEQYVAKRAYEAYVQVLAAMEQLEYEMEQEDAAVAAWVAEQDAKYHSSAEAK